MSILLDLVDRVFRVAIENDFEAWLKDCAHPYTALLRSPRPAPPSTENDMMDNVTYLLIIYFLRLESDTKNAIMDITPLPPYARLNLVQISL